MPPPSLSTTTIVRSMPRSADAEQGVGVVQEGDVAEEHGGRRAGGAGRRRGRWTSCRRCRWRPGWRARSRRHGARRTTRRRGPASTTRPRGARPRGGRRAAARAVPGSVGSSWSASTAGDRRLGRARRAPATRSSQPGLGCGQSSASAAPMRRGAVGRRWIEPGRGRRPRSAPRSRRATRSRPASGGGARRATTRSGRSSSRRSPVTRRSASACDTASRPASPTAGSASTGQRRRRVESTVRRRPASDEPSCSSVGTPSRTLDSRPTRPSTAMPAVVALGRQVAGLTDQRLAERQVQVHRAGAAPRPRPGAARLRQAWRDRLVGDAGVVEPAHGAAVEVGLVDGLRGADVAQLGRPVGGADEQRHAGLVGLDDGGVEVRRRRAAGAQRHRRRRAGRRCRQAEPERHERGAPLVVVHVDADARSSRSRASASGVDRLPGATTASVTPARAHSSTRVAQNVACGRRRGPASAPSCRMASSGDDDAPPSMLHAEVSRARAPASCSSTASPRTATAGDRSLDDLAADHEVCRVDAPGHGGSAAFHAGLRTGARLIADQGGEATYVGYSMGGRFLLHLALSLPELVRGLVLIGATAGIDDPDGAQRAGGRTRPWPQRLERDGVTGLPRRVAGASPCSPGSASRGPVPGRAGENTVEGLAESLRQAGTGAQDAALGPPRPPRHAGARRRRRGRREVHAPRPAGWASSIGAERRPSPSCPAPATPPTSSTPPPSSPSSDRGSRARSLNDPVLSAQLEYSSVMCRDIADTSVGTSLTLGAGLVVAAAVEGESVDEAGGSEDGEVVAACDD